MSAEVERDVEDDEDRVTVPQAMLAACDPSGLCAMDEYCDYWYKPKSPKDDVGVLDAT